jgi:RNA polymerase sigma factor (sigma-70 family)
VSGAIERAIGPGDGVEDLTQDVFVAVCETACRRGDIRDAQSYLAGTVAKLLRDHFDDRRPEVPLEPPESLVRLDGHAPTIDDEDRAMLRSLLLRLPHRKRLVVLAYHYLDLTHADIAVLLGLSRSTVRGHYADGVHVLREMAGRAGWNPFE